MDPQQIEELLPFYALDALSEEERELVEEYLAGHPEARQQIEGVSKAVEALPLSVARVEPSPRIKEALMRRITSDAEARLSKQRQSPRRLTGFENLFRNLGFAAAVVAFLWAVLVSVQVSQLRHQISSLNEALVAQSESIEQLNAKLPQTTPSNVITVSLKGTKVEPQAQGQLIANPASQSAVLVVTGLPPLEPGKTYQVWLIANAPVSAGLLTVDASGQGVLIITSKESIGSFKSLGISVEPKGGSQHPTGDIVVLSDI